MTELLTGALPSEPVLLTPDRFASAELMLFKLEIKKSYPRGRLVFEKHIPVSKPKKGVSSAPQVIGVQFLFPYVRDGKFCILSRRKRSRFQPHEYPYPLYFFSVDWYLLIQYD